MSISLAPPAIQSGKIKSFGAFGPKYEICRMLRQLADGDWMVSIKMVDSGEMTEYRLSRMTGDPDAL